jgi:hypothetical protein
MKKGTRRRVWTSVQVGEIESACSQENSGWKDRQPIETIGGCDTPEGVQHGPVAQHPRLVINCIS